MPASAETLRRYGGAVNRLAEAYADLEPLVTADEDQAVVQDTRLDDAIDDYVIESRQLFAETIESDPRAALASLGGDFRALAELGTATEGPDLTASDGTGTGLGDFTADMALVLTAASGPEADTAQVVLAGDGDHVSSAVASIDAISKTGLAKLRASITAAVLPNAAELGAVVSAVLGPEAGTQFATALKALSSWKDRIQRSAVKLLQAATDKVTALLGSTAADQIRKWIEGLLAPSLIYEEALRIPRLRVKAKTMLAVAPDAADRAARIAVIADHHGSDQRWIGWGATALSWAAPKLHAIVPWGPPVVFLASVALVVVCVWVTEDHLDSYDVAWLPDRIPGVGKVLA